MPQRATTCVTQRGWRDDDRVCECVGLLRCCDLTCVCVSELNTSGVTDGAAADATFGTELAALAISGTTLYVADAVGGGCMLVRRSRV